MILENVRRSLSIMFEPTSSKSQKPQNQHIKQKLHQNAQQKDRTDKPRDRLQSVPMAIKPPKAPSWRDFLPENRNDRRPSLDTSKLSDRKSCDDRLKINSLSPDHSQARTMRKQKHWKSKLHRTRSQLLLDPDDIPEQYTLSLAEARDRNLQLSSRLPELLCTERYMRQATDKCRRWLAGLENVEFEPAENWRRRDVMPTTSVSCGDLVNVGVTSSSSDDERRFSYLSIDEVRSQQTSGLL